MRFNICCVAWLSILLRNDWQIKMNGKIQSLLDSLIRGCNRSCFYLPFFIVIGVICENKLQGLNTKRGTQP